MSRNSFYIPPTRIPPARLHPLEESLQTWLRDPNATGEKEQAAERIRTVFQENLSSLHLDRLSLNTLPNAITELSVTSLDLSNNQLTVFPNNIRSLAELRQIDLADNPFTDVPDNIKELLPPKIQQIAFSSEQLTNQPENIGPLRIQKSRFPTPFLFYNRPPY